MTQNHTFTTLPALRIVATLVLAACLALPMAALPSDEPEAATLSEAGWFDQIWTSATQWLTKIWNEDEEAAPLSIHGEGELGPMHDPSGRR
ncbi:MAG: hypothetical protein AAF481_08435 [Acidobacteriota bacterium]